MFSCRHSGIGMLLSAVALEWHLVSGVGGVMKTSSLGSGGICRLWTPGQPGSCLHPDFQPHQAVAQQLLVPSRLLPGLPLTLTPLGVYLFAGILGTPDVPLVSAAQWSEARHQPESYTTSYQGPRAWGSLILAGPGALSMGAIWDHVGWIPMSGPLASSLENNLDFDSGLRAAMFHLPWPLSLLCHI